MAFPYRSTMHQNETGQSRQAAQHCPGLIIEALASRIRPCPAWQFLHGRFKVRWAQNLIILLRTLDEHSQNQATDFSPAKCAKPCFFQNSSAPVRDLKINHRAPSPVTFASVASNKAAPAFHPQLPQLMSSQRVAFSQPGHPKPCRLPRDDSALAPSVLRSQNHLLAHCLCACSCHLCSKLYSCGV